MKARSEVARSVFVVLLLLGALPGVAQIGSLGVTLKGSSGEPPAAGGYSLEMSASGTLEYDALYVYAGPGDTPLLTLVNGDAAEVERLFFEADLVGSKAILTGSPTGGRGRFLLPFRPGPRDDRIRVVLRQADRRVLIAEARVNPRRFEFASTVTFGLAKSGEPTFNHCCRSSYCGPLCATCTGPYFYCDLANCTETQCL